MKFCKLAIFVAVLFICVAFANGQSGSAESGGVLRGQVSDPSGAAIPGASVVMTSAAKSGAAVAKTQSDGQGGYEFRGLAAGTYSLTVAAPGFSTYRNDGVVIGGAQPLRLNVALTIQVEEEKVQVSDTAPTIDVNPSNNAGAIVLSGKELEALPDDPDDLLTDLQALAGPSAGPNGGQLYIDGFTAGQLPPKASIREIRINQNPFSAEFDKLGYGRIEVFTKPGTDKFHGQLQISGNDSVFNSPNPFGGVNQPGYYRTQYGGTVGGPINKKSSFFFDFERRDIADLSAVNAFQLVNGLEEPVIEAVPNPRHRTNIAPRIDYQLTKNNTLTARYQYFRNTEGADGVGQFNLPSQAYDSESTEHTLQISDTQLIGSKIVNELRFQYLREIDNQFAKNTAPTLNVPGAFGAGGNSQGDILDHQDHYELQNYTSVLHGNHTVKFGARLRGIRDANTTTSGFNGTFTFSSLLPQAQQTPCVPTPGQAPCPVAYSVYAASGGVGPAPVATQLSYTCAIGPSGCVPATPALVVNSFDAGLYYQDDWKIRTNITLSYGLRYEMQTGIQDHADWAPRLGFAWGVGGKSSPPKVVLRGGYGIFYDRFQVGQILEASLLNGVTQEQFVIDNPVCSSSDFRSCTGFVVPARTAVYQISPRLHAPYTMQAAVSVERQVTKSATLNVTYLNSRGFDQLLTINANAPFPGTPCSPLCPTPAGGNLYEYESEAVFRQNQLIANTNVRVGTRVQLFGYYVLNYANSDASGVSSFPSNSYHISQDYGRAAFDTRQRLFFGGSVGLPNKFRLSPFMIVSSGTPFNITTTNDLNNDSIFNDRPGLAPGASCTAPNIYCTTLGTFDANPGAPAVAGEKLLPINYGTGPAHAVLNLRLTRTFGFGPKTKGKNLPQGGGPGGGGGGPVSGGGHGGGGGRGPLFGGGPGGGMSSNTDRRYNLTFGITARNVFNKVNLASPSGILGSRFFDTSNQLQQGPFSNGAANRRLDLQATFSF